MRAIAPKVMIDVPAGVTGWRRSTKRAGTMFHAHKLGFPVCNARLRFDRHDSVASKGIDDFRYFGVCPNCYKIVNRATAPERPD